MGCCHWEATLGKGGVGSSRTGCAPPADTELVSLSLVSVGGRHDLLCRSAAFIILVLFIYFPLQVVMEISPHHSGGSSAWLATLVDPP